MKTSRKQTSTTCPNLIKSKVHKIHFPSNHPLQFKMNKKGIPKKY
jgi:hypothetical protein